MAPKAVIGHYYKRPKQSKNPPLSIPSLRSFMNTYKHARLCLADLLP